MNPNNIFLYRFWVQVAISLLVLVFCGFGLISGGREGRRNETLYSNLVFLVIGYWFPSPGQNKQQEGGTSIGISEQTIVNSGDVKDANS